MHKQGLVTVKLTCMSYLVTALYGCCNYFVGHTQVFRLCGFCNAHYCKIYVPSNYQQMKCIQAHKLTQDTMSMCQVIEEDGLQANSGRVGDVMLRGMLSLREEFEVVGDVRGRGLMLGMELVKSKVSIQW